MDIGKGMNITYIPDYACYDALFMWPGLNLELFFE